MATIVAAVLGAAVISYLLGSISFAVIVSRIFSHDDVRSHGSGSAGMTNVLRTYGKGPAAVTAAGDFLKAVAAIFLSRHLFGLAGIEAIDAGYIAGLFVILGHVYPLYFGFRGGKGVMTTLGVAFVVNPTVCLIIVAVFLPVVFIVKIVSVVSILGAVSYPIVTYIMARAADAPSLFNTLFASIYAAIILIMHRGNIKRLLNGTEHKFGEKKRD